VEGEDQLDATSDFYYNDDGSDNSFKSMGKYLEKRLNDENEIVYYFDEMEVYDFNGGDIYKKFASLSQLPQLPQLSNAFETKFIKYEGYGDFVKKYAKFKSEFDTTTKEFQVSNIVTDIDKTIFKIGIPHVLQDETINELRREVREAAQKRKSELKVREAARKKAELKAREAEQKRQTELTAQPKSAPTPDDLEEWERKATSPVIDSSSSVIDSSPSVIDSSSSVIDSSPSAIDSSPSVIDSPVDDDPPAGRSFSKGSWRRYGGSRRRKNQFVA